MHRSVHIPGCNFIMYYYVLFWGIGAVGSAFDWQSRGDEFESRMLHVTDNIETIIATRLKIDVISVDFKPKLLLVRVDNKPKLLLIQSGSSGPKNKKAGEVVLERVLKIMGIEQV